MYEEVLGIDFQSSADANADFRFGDANSGAYAYVSRLGGTINYVNVNININSAWHAGRNGLGNYTFQTILHEIGHGLGLGRQGNYNGDGNYANADFANDSWQTSMMSYFDQVENTSITATKAYLSSPMSVDWISLDDLYSGYGYGLIMLLLVIQFTALILILLIRPVKSLPNSRIMLVTLLLLSLMVQA